MVFRARRISNAEYRSRAFFAAWWYRVAMLHNRSVPVDTVLPHIFYRDLEAAIGWLARSFGFAERYRYGEPVAGAQLLLGNAYVMVSTLRPPRAAPATAGIQTQSLTVFVEDVEQHYARARAAGVTIVEQLHQTVYGELQYGAEDLDGHHWLFSRHARDVSPQEWGATAAGQ
jgi:uncharacterized glyoxalase superfamily protein PhnB